MKKGGRILGKMAVVYVVTLCSLCGDDRPDGGGSKRLGDVGKLVPEYTVQNPKSQPSLY
jgi:hypothetical protein